MNKIKEFIKKKKVDNKFKNLGQGYSLSDGQQQPCGSENSAEARARAVEALEKRLNQGKSELNFSQKNVYMRAKQEIEEEMRREEKDQSVSPVQPQSDQLINTNKEDGSVLYTCDLLEELALPKSEMYEAIETFLREQLNGEGVDASILMINSLNSVAKSEAAISIIKKYITNIVEHPDDYKYRRIRLSNKVFSEKVKSVKGALEFLTAIGFIEDQSLNEKDEVETFLVLPEPNESLLLNALQELESGNCVSLKLFRDPKVFIIDPSKPVPRPAIPSDFYNLTAAEIKSLQDAKSREVERMTTLRTSKMREMEASSNTSSYKYTLIRVRFPNNYVLQGTFNVHETLDAVREFVGKHLDFQFGTFILSSSMVGRYTPLEEKSLLELGLVPSAYVHFDWDADALLIFYKKTGNPISTCNFLKNLYSNTSLSSNVLRRFCAKM